MLNDVFRDAILDDDVVDITSTNDETSTFTVMEDANYEIYPNCKFTEFNDCMFVSL